MAVGVCLQVIKLELAPGKVERATLHIIELAASAHETRVAAMQHLSPIHTFMFDSKGTLLVANASAVEACQRGLTGVLGGTCCHFWVDVRGGGGARGGSIRAA